MTRGDEIPAGADPSALAAAAQRALERGEIGRAVGLFREASRLAPFRQDIRDALAMTLEMAIANGIDISSESTPAPYETQPSAPSQPPRQPVLRPPRPSAASDRGPLFEEGEDLGGSLFSRPAGASSVFPSDIDASEEAQRGRPASRAPAVALKRLRPKSSLVLRLWFAGLTVFVCLCAVAFVIAFMPVREMIEDWQMSPKERRIRKLNVDIVSQLTQRNYEKALELIDEAMAMQPDDPRPLKKKKSEALLALGDTAFEREQFQDSIDSYSKAVEADSDSAEAFFRLGQAYFCLGRKTATDKQRAQQLLQRAESSYKTSLILEPDNVAVYDALANTYVRINRSEEAVKAWVRIMQLAPDSLEAKQAIKNLIARGKDPKKLLRGETSETDDSGKAADKAKPEEAEKPPARGKAADEAKPARKAKSKSTKQDSK